MKFLIFGIAVAGLLTGSISFAQTTPGTASAGTAAASGNNNQAVATTRANAQMPAKGSNSFTMGEAKSRIEKNGFSNVSNLVKDNNGVWRGQGQKDGSAAPVWLDYKGNVGQGQ